MKRIAFLFIMLWLLAMSSAMAWEAAVHAKATQDACRVLGLDEADANLIGDGAWFDGNDWIVTGKGQLEVIDVTGRVMLSRHVNGEQTRVNLHDVAAGV